MATNSKVYTFKIQLNVLDHLGRKLYRNFITVLGEAISNSWDADAKNVWIKVDKDNDSFTIKDDGVGMDEDDFENKFLAVGYSKRTPGPDGITDNAFTRRTTVYRRKGYREIGSAFLFNSRQYHIKEE